MAEPLVSWAHSESGVPPNILDAKDKRILLEKHSSWKLVNDYVSLNGPFDPLKLFKHGPQTFYSRTKGSFDGYTQYRSKLRSSMVVFKWKRKFMAQTIKSIVANAFIIWNINRWSDLLESKEKFQNLEKYPASINRGVSFGTLVLDLYPKLVRYADQMAPKESSAADSLAQISANTEEEELLRERVSQNRWNKISFFNSPDGRKIRLQLQPHPQRHTHQHKHCALCGSGVKRHRGKFMCISCGVHLCVRVSKDKRRSCWSKWQAKKRLDEVQTI